MKDETITVVMAIYNVAATITETIQSVLNQTYKDLYLLIIDDGSTDGTNFIVTSFAKQDSRIHYVQMPHHQGIAYVRNYGVQHAPTEWVAFLDGDDIWREDKIEKQVRLRDRLLRDYPEPFDENGDAIAGYPAILFTATAYMDHKGNRYNYILHAPEMVKFKKLLKQNVISCSSTFVSRKVMPDFPTDGNLHEDFFAWLNITKKGFLAYGVDEPLLTYRMAKDSQSGNKFKSAKKNFNVYKKLRFSGLKSFYYMVFYTIKNANKYSKIRKSR